jgi:hypothetical protein
MPSTGVAGVYPKFHGFDEDGLPLEGGKLYSFLSGTSTPQALYADAELTTELPNPVILDSSGEALFYYGPATYKLALHDANDVPLWVIDPVTGTGGGGAAAAGLGFGQNTLELRPVPGAAQVTGSVFPAGVLAVGLTVWVSETFGTSQGLQQIGVGSPALPDAWGRLSALTADSVSTAGSFLSYGGQPQPTQGLVTLTAYGGLFDGTGALYVTGHFLTMSPSRTVGMTYSPPPSGAADPVPPLLYATETTTGGVELIDSAEVLLDSDLTRALTIGRLVSRTGTPLRLGLLKTSTPAAVVTGTNDTDAATPLGVSQALAARVPTGTPLSVARYASGGVSLEGSPLTVDAASNLRLGAAVPGTSLSSGLVLTSGVAPTAAHPADAIQLWVADMDGTAGQAALHLRDETGILTRIGTGILHRKRTRTLTTNGVSSPYALTTDLSGLLLIGNGGTEIQYIQLPVINGAVYVGVFFTVLNNQASPRGTRLVCNTGQFLRVGTLLTTSGGYAQTQVAGDFMVVVCYAAGQWTALSPQLGWTVG